MRKHIETLPSGLAKNVRGSPDVHRSQKTSVLKHPIASRAAGKQLRASNQDLWTENGE